MERARIVVDGEIIFGAHWTIHTLYTPRQLLMRFDCEKAVYGGADAFGDFLGFLCSGVAVDQRAAAGDKLNLPLRYE